MVVAKSSGDRSVVPHDERIHFTIRSIDRYRLFASMRTERIVVVLQRSADGEQWRTYEFRHKPGIPRREAREGGLVESRIAGLVGKKPHPARAPLRATLRG